MVKGKFWRLFLFGEKKKGRKREEKLSNTGRKTFFLCTSHLLFLVCCWKPLEDDTVCESNLHDSADDDDDRKCQSKLNRIRTHEKISLFFLLRISPRKFVELLTQKPTTAQTCDSEGDSNSKLTASRASAVASRV